MDGAEQKRKPGRPKSLVHKSDEVIANLKKVEHFNLRLPESGGASICLVGASRSGKTTLLKYLYNHYFKKHISTLYSFSLQNEIYDDFKKCILANEYYPELVKECYYVNHKTDNKFDFLFIFDDILGSAMKADKQILRLLTVLRNSDMSSIYSVQDPTLMSSIGRGNANFICIFKQNSDSEIEKVIKQYLRSYFPPKMSMNEKIHLFKEMTSDHEFVFIDNLNNTMYLTKLTEKQMEE